MRGEAGRAGKRPLRSLTAIEKISAIRRVHEGESKASVARDLSVPESTLRGWCKSEQKIRSMARNSSTPDSNEAHSPLSSSGIINNNNNINNLTINGNHLNDDDGQTLKRLKLDSTSSASMHSTKTGYYTNENLENEITRLSDPSKIDYLSLMTSMAAMRPENNALLLQHLGLLGGNNNTLAKNLLNLPNTINTPSSTVGLVENGLQYTKSNVNININNNHVTNTNNNHHINNNINMIKRHSASALTPTQSYTRKSSPPAAEIPLTPDPASPRKTSDLHNHHHSNQNNNNNTHNYNSNNNNTSMNYLYNNNNNSSKNNNNNISSQNYNHRDSKKNNNNNNNTQIPSLNTNKKFDESLLLWMSSQNGAMNFNQQDSGLYASWFWQWYKQQQQQLQPPQQQQQQQQLINGKKSPSKTRALLDSVLCNNNNNNNNNNDNDNAKKTLNSVFDVFIEETPVTNDTGIGAPQTAALPLTTTSSPPSSTTTTSPTTTSNISSEEAIEHGEQFFKWLNKCSDPSVSRLQIMQIKYLLDNLKKGKNNQSTHMKQKRK